MWGLLVLGAARAVSGAGRGGAEPRGRGAVQGVASAALEQEVGEEEEEKEEEAATATYVEAQREQRVASGTVYNGANGTAGVRPQPAWAELGLSVAYGRMTSAQPEHLARMLWCAATLGARVGGAAEEREGWDGGAAARVGRRYEAQGESEEAEDGEEGGEEEEEEEEGEGAVSSEPEPAFGGSGNNNDRPGGASLGSDALAVPHFIDGGSGTISDGSDVRSGGSGGGSGSSGGGPLVVPHYWLRRFFRQTAGRLDEFDALSFSSTLWALARLKVWMVVGVETGRV